MSTLLEFIHTKEDCTGCTACMAVCPAKCITMKEDLEGFKYPVKNEKCINCGLCEKICPTGNNKKLEYKQKVYATISKDMAIWKRSSSGGMFSEICKVLEADNAYVYGAYFNGLKVEHGCRLAKENIDVFRKSKYIQSDLKNSFIEIKERLDAGRHVVFSGTPCQVAGLKSYLKKDYEKLFCIDFICHGVGSPKVFFACIKYWEKNNKNVVGYEFRYKKRRLGNYERYLSKRTYSDGKVKIEANDIYMRLFLSQLCLRPSCSVNCRFRTSNRMSDITLADFNGLEEIYEDIKDNKNYSTLIINSSKGQKVFEKMKNSIVCYPCDLAVIKKYNPLLDSRGRANDKRNEFFEKFIDDDKAVNKYAAGLGFSPQQIIVRSLPWKVKYYIKKVLRKLR